MTDTLLAKLKKLTPKIESELDAHTFVRIYLDAVGTSDEDREQIYDALGESDPRFKDIFVARMILQPTDFMTNGLVKLGGNTIPNLVLQNNYHGILYIKKGIPPKTQFTGLTSHDETVEIVNIPTSAFVSRTGTAFTGKYLNKELYDRTKAGEPFYGILELRTDKYHETEPCLKLVKLGRKMPTQKEAVINTQFNEKL